MTVSSLQTICCWWALATVGIAWFHLPQGAVADLEVFNSESSCDSQGTPTYYSEGCSNVLNLGGNILGWSASYPNGTVAQSISVDCLATGTVNLYEDPNCEVLSGTESSEFCFDVVSAAEGTAGKVFARCATGPPEPPQMTAHMFFGQCSTEEGNPDAFSDGCYQFGETGAFFVNDIAYPAVRINCGSENTIYFSSTADCNGPLVYASDSTCVAYSGDWSNQTTPVAMMCIQATASPTVQDDNYTVDVWQNQQCFAAENPSFSTVDECVTNMAEEIVVDGMSFASFKIECGSFPSRFAFYTSNTCEGFPSYSVYGSACFDFITGGNSTNYYAVCRPHYSATTSLFYSSCPALQAGGPPLMEQPDNCLSGIGNSSYYVNGSYFGSVSIRCDPSGTNRGFGFHLDHTCSGPTVAFQIGEVCLDAEFNGTSNPLAFKCKASSPPSTATITRFGVGNSTETCSNSPPLGSEPIVDGCIQGQDFGLTWVVAGTTYNSLQVNCKQEIPGPNRGFLLFQGSQCTGDGTALLGSIGCAEVNFNGTIMGYMATQCLAPPASLSGAYRYAQQCPVNGSTNVSPATNVNEGCRRAQESGVAYWEFEGINGSIQYQSMQVQCQAGEGAAGYKLFQNNNCEPTESSPVYGDLCLSEIRFAGNETFVMHANFFCENSTTGPGTFTPTISPPSSPAAIINFGQCSTTQGAPTGYMDGCYRFGANSSFFLNGSEYRSIDISCGREGFIYFSHNTDCSGPPAFATISICAEFSPDGLANQTNPITLQCNSTGGVPEPPRTETVDIWVGQCSSVGPPAQSGIDECIGLGDDMTVTVNNRTFGSFGIECGATPSRLVYYSGSYCSGPVQYSLYGQTCMQVGSATEYNTFTVACKPRTPILTTLAYNSCSDIVAGSSPLYELGDSCLSGNGNHSYFWGGNYYGSVSIKCNMTDSNRGFAFHSDDTCSGSPAMYVTDNVCLQSLLNGNSSTSLAFKCKSLPPPRQATYEYVSSCPSTTLPMSLPNNISEGCRTANQSGVGYWQFPGNPGMEFRSIQVNCQTSNGGDSAFRFFQNDHCGYDNTSSPSLPEACLDEVSFIGQTKFSYNVHYFCKLMQTTPPTFSPTLTPPTATYANTSAQCNTTGEIGGFLSDQCYGTADAGIRHWRIGAQNYTSVEVHCQESIGPIGFSFYTQGNCTGAKQILVNQGCMDTVLINGQTFTTQVKCLSTAAPTPSAPAQALIKTGPGNETCASLTQGGFYPDTCIVAKNVSLDTFQFSGKNYSAVQINCSSVTNPGFKLLTNASQCNTPVASVNMSSSLCFAGLANATITRIQAYCQGSTTAPNTVSTPFPTTANTGTPRPTQLPTASPSSAPTGRTPVLLGAQLTKDLSKIEVDFDDNTNQRNSPQRSSCSPWLQFNASDSGCSGGPCPVSCYWASARRVIIDLNPLSNFNLTSNLTVYIPPDSFIRHSFAVSGNVTGKVSVTVPFGNLTAPSVSLSGPNFVSLCGNGSLVIQSSLAGTGGRIPTFEWRENGVKKALATEPQFKVIRPNESSVVNYSVTVTNFANLQAQSSFSINFTNEARAQVVLSAPPTFTVDATGSISLSAVVNLPAACVPPGFSLANASYAYAWKISREVDPQTVLSVGNLALNRSKLTISPASLLAPGDSYRIDLDVDPRIPGVLPGHASTVVSVVNVPVIAALSVPQVFSVERLKNISLSAARSCDPNRASPVCRPGSGQTERNLTMLRFQWLCRDASNNVCDSVCQDGNGNPCDGVCREGQTTACDGVCASCLIANGTLTSALSPYTFFANVSSRASGTWALTPNISVEVLPDPLPQCVRPSIEMQPFPTKINVAQSGEAQLRSVVKNFDFNPTEGRNYQWFIVSRDNGHLSSPSGLIDQSVSLNRPNLVLQLSKLAPGATYVFRLVATLPCTQGSDAFGEITFTTNSPPVGGVVSVSPMSGRAGLDDFQLSIAGASDEDLPLSYSFEYRTDFSSSEPAYSTLSAFSQSSQLTTRFSQASRIMVIARVRDSLQATTSRAQSPFVDNVQANELVIAPGALPFNAAQQVQDVLGSGASGEDALRVAAALAAAAGSNSGGEMSEEVLQWRQETQNTLLNLIADTAPEADDPSFVMLQSSALASILNGSESVQDVTTPAGQQFLNKAAGLVGSLLESARSAILAQGSGADDPLLSQYRPGDLGDVTLGNLKSILNAIQSSSLRNQRRRRRLLREDPQRWLEAQQGSQQVVGSVRDQLRKLADVMLLGAVSGSAPQVIRGAEMRVVAVSEAPDLIGTTSKLTTISIPAFNENDPPTVFTLPRDVLRAFSFGGEDLVNIIAVRFRFNIRELAGTVNAPNLTMDENAPMNNVTEMLALDFQRNASDGTLHPFNLTDTIKIRLPVPYQEMPNNTKLSCGFFNDTLNVWSSSGCNVTEFSLPVDEQDTTGYMICECNHASDYAAWQAFVKDVNSVFNPVDTSNLSTIAAVVLGVLLPVLALTWIGSQQLARMMDKRDSDHIHYGTFVAITRRKLELHDRQRRFFRILRENKGPIPMADLSKYRELGELSERKAEDERTMKAFRILAKRLLGLVALGSSATSALMFSGVFISFYYQTDISSLSDLVMMLGVHREAFGLALASGVVSLLSALLLSVVYVLDQCDVSRGNAISAKFAILLALQLINATLGLAAFSVPIAHQSSELSGVGTGLTLVVIGGCVGVVTCFFAWAALFLHQLGPKLRSTGWEFLRNIARGMVYEQTLVSAFSRFDPYFDRSKRFSIVIAVIVGNLFACSVFFALRNGQEVSFGLVLASTVVSSLIVAIPIKVALRILFRLTKSREGSKMNRIAQIFRMTAFSYDIHPSFASDAEKLDVEMLTAFRRLYFAKHNVKLLKRFLAAKAAEKAGPLSLTHRMKQCWGRLASSGEEEFEVEEEKSFKRKINEKTGEWEYDQEEEKIIDVRQLNPDHITEATLLKARKQFAQVRRELKASVERSQQAWAGQEKRFSYVSRKQELVQREHNALLQWALAFAEEPHARPKIYQSVLDHRFSILAWTILLVYYIGCILWICFWIFSRNGQSRDALIEQGNAEPTNAEIGAQTNAYLLAWLGTSFFGVFLGYFVFEPALVVIRFAMLPLLVRALRPEATLNPEEVEIVDKSSKQLTVYQAEETEVKPSWFHRLCCCCCSPRRIRDIQNRAVDMVVIVVEALV